MGSGVPGSERPARSPRTILVVDDDPDSADSMALLLEHWNWRVRVAYDGAGAIEAFRKEGPLVALIDVGLPDMDGYEVARTLRRDGRPAMLVAVTGYGEEEDRRESAEAGFDRHIVKPVDIPALRRLLEEISGS